MPITAKIAETPFMKRIRQGLLTNIKDKYSENLKTLHTSSEEWEHTHATVEIYVDEILASKKTLSTAQKKVIRDRVLDEIFGFGPLGPFLRHPHVANIYLEGSARAYIEKYGPRGARKIEKVKMTFDDDEHLLDVIHRIIMPFGLELNQATPVANCILPNGSRIYASLPPVSVHGPMLSIICKEHSNEEVVPYWRLTFEHFNKLHRATSQKITVDGVETQAIQVHLPESRSNSDFSQVIAARPLREKTISFGGVLQLEPVEAEETNAAWEGKIDQCPPAGASVYIAILGRGHAQISREGQSLDLEYSKPLHFSCSIAVPPQAVSVRVGVRLRGPVQATISQLQFDVEKPAVLRAGQGPKNMELNAS